MLSDEELHKAYMKGKKLFLTKKPCPYQRQYEQWQDDWIKDDCDKTNEEYKGFVDAWRESNKKNIPMMKKFLQFIGIT
jgi:hypothetical protein